MGRWYGTQVQNYVDALQTLTRMTNNEIANQEINSLLQTVRASYDRKTVLWNGLYGICRKYFSGSDKCSRAIHTYYDTIIKKL